MTAKEIKARYKRAYFGFLWVVLNPLMQMVVIGLVFSYFIEMKDYYLFLFSGLLPWGFFALSLAKATPSFVHERSLLQKAKFSKEVIPVSIVLANFFHLVVGMGLLLAYLAIIGRLEMANIWILSAALVWLLAFTIGVSLLTASLNVKYRDMTFFVQSVLILWFYATPVLYSINLIPDEVRRVFALNPLASVFELIHWGVLGQNRIDGEMLGKNIVLGFVVMVAGVLVYKREHKYFVDWL